MLRGALRSGDVWVEGSRRYADPQRYLIPKDRWPSVKEAVRLQTGASAEGAEQLTRRKRELGRVLGRLRTAVSRGGSIQVQAGRLVFSRERSELAFEEAHSLIPRPSIIVFSAFQFDPGRGVHPKLVQHLLGHASITMILDTYSQPSMGRLTAEGMDKALG